jgi:hypothetical protein
MLLIPMNIWVNFLLRGTSFLQGPYLYRKTYMIQTVFPASCPMCTYYSIQFFISLHVYSTARKRIINKSRAKREKQ